MDGLPKSIMQRIVILNNLDELYKKALSLLSPTINEFKFIPTNDWHRPTAFVQTLSDDNNSGQVCYMSNYILRHLMLLLIGIRHKCQIEIDIRTVVLFIKSIIGISRDPQARFNLKALLNIFCSYKEVTIPSLRMVSELPREHRLEFEKLLLDEQYKILSDCAFDIGYPEKLSNVLNRLRVQANLLAKNPLCVGAFKVVNRIIHAILRVKIVDKEDWNHLDIHEYYPPVISLAQSIEAAYHTHSNHFGRGNMFQSHVGPNWNRPILF